MASQRQGSSKGDASGQLTFNPSSDDMANQLPQHLPSQAPVQAPSASTRPIKVRQYIPRPNVHEKRNDFEPTVYRELPEFPSFNEAIPATATLEEICIKYPNHIRGSYLDAFIQYHWTANDIYAHLSDASRDAFIRHKMAKPYPFGNRANIFGKRLAVRMSELKDDELERLCNAPKIRGCFIAGGVYMGKSKLQGRVHNPTAAPIRTYEHRRGRAQGPKPSIVAAAEKTFIYRGKEYPIWASAEGMEIFKRQMAAHWTKQKACASEIINADDVHGFAGKEHQTQLVLQIANWPLNKLTETFFNFDDVETCPGFVESINHMVVPGIVKALDMVLAQNGMTPMADQNISGQVAQARASAMDYVLSAQAVRTLRLESFALELPDLAAGMAPGIVDQVLSWNQDAEETNESPMVETQPAWHNPYGTTLPSAGIAAPTLEQQEVFHSPYGKGIPLAEWAAAPIPETPPVFHNPYGKSNSVSQSPVRVKRSRDPESAEQVIRQKRVRFAEDIETPNSGFADSDHHQLPAFNNTQFTEITLGLQMPLDFIGIDNQPAENTATADVNGTQLTPGAEHGFLNFDFTGGIVNMPELPPAILDYVPAIKSVPDHRVDEAGPFHPTTGYDFVRDPAMGQGFRQTGQGSMPGAEAGLNSVAQVAETGNLLNLTADVMGGADFDRLSWDLPEMIDNDPPWLREAVANAQELDPSEAWISDEVDLAMNGGLPDP